jgi:hypothetical protein
MPYHVAEPRRDTVKDQEGQSHRFYPYPKENSTPSGISHIARSAPGFGFIIQKTIAIYGNKTCGLFTPARG